MPLPKSPNARLFYRCALHRHEEAQVLLKAEFTTGAVYLAGYGVECILKALVLDADSLATQTDTLRSFRGNNGHDYEWLRSLYFIKAKTRFPAEITRQFTLVNEWSTDLRYSPRSFRNEEAGAFVASAENIIKWADGRL